MKNRSTRVMYAGAYLLLAFPLVVFAYQGFPVPLFSLSPIVRAGAVVVILASITSVVLRREGRSIADYGLSFSLPSLKALLVGFLSGFVLFSIAAVALRVALPFEWVFKPSVPILSLFTALIYHLATNACEELAWRGFAFDNLIQSLGLWPAQMIVALVAACFHVVCGWTWEAALLSTTAGSVLFGLVFYRWRSLPAAIGLHSAWNWARDLIFSPGTNTAFLSPVGTEKWTQSQWNLAQAILVVATLSAAAVLARGTTFSSSPRTHHRVPNSLG